ncbi:MAG TPA: hypothetical protein DIC64_04055 [Alphaproteobacteria bacterium]|nr:hypothetical protein [Alphaproteobacteria bacterium]
MEENKKSSMQILQDTVQRQYPDIERPMVKTVAREMLFAPQGRLVEIDEKRRLAAEDLRFVTASTLEKPSIENNMLYANSVERINSSIDPVAEYFDWLSETTLILNHLNDGFVTKEDALQREAFLDLTDQREADLMLCLGLYESCGSQEAKERARFTRYKLQKLREMRTSIKFLTRQGHEVETTRSEYDAAIPYYKYFKNLQKLPFGYDMPYEQKIKLGISHDDDEDLSEDYDHYRQIINEMLDEMKKEDKAAVLPENNREEYITQISEQNEDLTRR